jgi:peptide subunit release factor 1 (eRF1)
METFFSANPGLNSRVPNKIFFGDYSNNELIQICKNLLKDKKYVADANVVKEVVKIVENKRNRKDFANAREVRNVLEQLYRIQARRTIDCEEDRTLTLEDIEIYKNKNKDKTKIIK